MERAKAMAIESSEIAAASAGQGFSPRACPPCMPRSRPVPHRRPADAWRSATGLFAGTGDGRGAATREGLRLTPTWPPRMRLRAEPLRACTQEGQAQAAGGARRDSQHEAAGKEGELGGLARLPADTSSISLGTTVSNRRQKGARPRVESPYVNQTLLRGL